MISMLVKILPLKQLPVILVCLVVSGILSAQDLPDKPEIQRVTVDTSYHGEGYRIIIEWLPSGSTDVEFYLIYKDTLQDAFTKIDSVSADITSYLYEPPRLESLKYTVTAKDSEGNESLLTPGVHRVMLLSVQFDTCYRENILSWTPYEGWDDDLSVYRVYVAEGDDPMAFLGIAEPYKTTYKHSNITDNQSYRYLIEAVKNQDNLVSHSTFTAQETRIADPPSYMLIDYVDVLDNGFIEISVTADIGGRVKDFQLLRSTNPDAGFQHRYSYSNQSTFIFNDKVISSGTQYFYRVDAIYQPAGCPNSEIIGSSNVRSSIFLMGEENNNRVHLTWTRYGDSSEDIDRYLVLRKTKADDEFIEIASLGNAEPTQYWELISSILNGKQSGKIEYMVRAISSPDMFERVYEINSNIISIELVTSLTMPNAFTPNGDGQNDFFGPVIDFAPEKFLMIIYDRLGKKLFQTESPYEGWDGKFMGGGKVMEGVYVYHVQYTEYFTGSIKTETGTVTVIYP